MHEPDRWDVLLALRGWGWAGPFLGFSFSLGWVLKRGTRASCLVLGRYNNVGTQLFLTFAFINLGWIYLSIYLGAVEEVMLPMDSVGAKKNERD